MNFSGRLRAAERRAALEGGGCDVCCPDGAYRPARYVDVPDGGSAPPEPPCPGCGRAALVFQVVRRPEGRSVDRDGGSTDQDGDGGNEEPLTAANAAVEDERAVEEDTVLELRPERARTQAPATAPDSLMTTKDVARRLALSVRTVWRFVRQGVLPQPVRFNRKNVRLRASDVQRWLSQLDLG